jgi:UDP-2,4-diacetamido-2,4,6-trideoxy-beta-L-altropyranose hydrolase
VTVVLGAGNSRADEIRAAASRAAGRMRVESNVSDMARWMTWADLAVSSAGSTSWELCFLGLPAIVLATADCEQPVAESLQQNGACLSLGRAKAMDGEALTTALEELIPAAGSRAAMSAAGRRLVDGRGGERVLDLLKENVPCT